MATMTAGKNGHLNQLERNDLERMRSSADIKRAKRIQDARAAVRSFAGDHVDVCAMALMTLRWTHPGRTITRTEVLARARANYPEAGI
jgi:cobalamin biosynthesis protein CbiD